jgi:hypothetical protein
MWRVPCDPHRCSWPFPVTTGVFHLHPVLRSAIPSQGVSSVFKQTHAGDHRHVSDTLLRVISRSSASHWLSFVSTMRSSTTRMASKLEGLRAHEMLSSGNTTHHLVRPRRCLHPVSPLSPPPSMPHHPWYPRPSMPDPSHAPPKPSVLFSPAFKTPWARLLSVYLRCRPREQQHPAAG